MSGEGTCIGGVRFQTRTIRVPARYLYGSIFSDFTDAGVCDGESGSGSGSGGGPGGDCCGVYISSDTGDYVGAEQFIIIHDTPLAICSPGVAWSVTRDGLFSPIEINALISLPPIGTTIVGRNLITTLTANLADQVERDEELNHWQLVAGGGAGGAELHNDILEGGVLQNDLFDEAGVLNNVFGNNCLQFVGVGLTNPDDDYSVVWSMAAGPPEWTDVPEVRRLIAREYAQVGVAEDLTGEVQFLHQDHEHKTQVYQNTNQDSAQKIILPSRQPTQKYQSLMNVKINGGLEAVTEWVGFSVHNQSAEPDFFAEDPFCDIRELVFDPICFAIGLADSPGGCDPAAAVIGDGPDVTDELNDEIVKDKVPYIITQGTTGDFYGMLIVLDEETGEPCIYDTQFFAEFGLVKIIYAPTENPELTAAVFGPGVGCAPEESGSGSGSGSGSNPTLIPNPGYVDVITCVDIVDGEIRVQKTRITLPPWIKLFDLGCEIAAECSDCPELIDTECCNDVPSVLNVNIQSTDCDAFAAPGLDTTITWNPANQRWEGVLSDAACVEETEPVIWLECDGGTWNVQFGGAAEPGLTESSCSPFLLIFGPGWPGAVVCGGECGPFDQYTITITA